MSKPVNKTMIGAFVVGALALAVAAVLVLGSGKLFKTRRQFVLYFNESVKGLTAGAPVVFQGVKIGSVRDVFLVADLQKLTLRIPVIIEIEPDRIRMADNEQETSDEELKQLIRRGLRAQLQLLSPVTGKLMIEFGFYPKTPIHLSGAASRVKGLPQIPELPTVPSNFELFFQTLKKLDLKKMAKKINSAVDGFERLISSPETARIPSSLNAALEGIRRLSEHLDAQVGPLGNDARSALNAFNTLAGNANGRLDRLSSSIDQTLAEVRQLARELNAQTRSLKPALAKSFESLQTSLEQIRRTVADMGALFDPDAPMLNDLHDALQELSEASRAIRFLADYLNRNPNALIRGRLRPEGR